METEHRATWDEIRKVHPWLPSSSEVLHQHANGGGWVQDTASVYDKALVCGEALVSPIYIHGTRYWMCCSGRGLISSGCITKPVAWWIENVERCAEENGYDATQQKEYRLHVEHIAAWMELYGMLDEQEPTP